jgi:hypothetical protein
MNVTESAPVEVEVPVMVADLGLLDRVDYEDAFQVETASDRTPQELMRAFLEGAPRWFTLPWIVVLGGGLLGVDPRVLRRPGHLMGWKVLRDGPDAFVIGFDSPRGLTARLIAVTPPNRAIVATQIQLDTAYARALWAGGVRRGHRYFLPFLLARATSR